MRRLYFLFVTSFMVFLPSCSVQSTDIPLVIYNHDDPYIAEFEQQIMDKAIGRFKVTSYDSQNSQIIQNEFIDDLIKTNPPVIIINPVDRLGAYTIIEKAKEANIPVIFTNREPLTSDLNIWSEAYYVGALDAQSAEIQGDMVIELFGSPEELSIMDKNDDDIIQMIILKGEQGHQAAEIRTTRIVNYLETYGYELEIQKIEVCDWIRENAYSFMKQYIPDNIYETEIIISNNDAMALGAIDALVEEGILTDENSNRIYGEEGEYYIPVLGIDAIQEAKPYLRSNSLYGTVLNDSTEMAEAIVELAEAIINGTDINSINYEIIDDHYIWVEYHRYEEDED